MSEYPLVFKTLIESLSLSEILQILWNHLGDDEKQRFWESEDYLCEVCDENIGTENRNECGCKMLCKECVKAHDQECEDFKRK